MFFFFFLVGIFVEARFVLGKKRYGVKSVIDERLSSSRTHDNLGTFAPRVGLSIVTREMF